MENEGESTLEIYCNLLKLILKSIEIETKSSPLWSKFFARWLSIRSTFGTPLILVSEALIAQGTQIVDSCNTRRFCNLISSQLQGT